MSYFIYTDTISSLLDPKLVDSGSTLVHTALKCSYQLTFVVFRKYKLMEEGCRKIRKDFMQENIKLS